MPSVARLNVTPVKSTRLHQPDSIRLERSGAVANREFFFVGGDGRRFGGDRKTPLLPLQAGFDAERNRLSFRLPNGLEVEGPAAATGRPLVVDFYGRPVEAHVVEGDWNEAISRYAEREVWLARPDHPGDANDERPVTIVSLASVEELSRQGGREEPVDARRFRMLIELDGCAPHEEDTWHGRAIRIGEAVIAVGEQVPRCVITTLDPDSGVHDFSTLKVIKNYRGISPDGDLPFGVYGDVLEPGTIRVGDPVQLLPPPTGVG
jgi:uncharacterized protein